MNIKQTQRQGECAKCQSVNLDYGETEHNDDELGYHYRCLGCGHNGIEWYRLEFIESE